MNLRQKLYDYLYGDAEIPISVKNLYYQFLLKVKPNSSILDIGVGTGLYFDDIKCIDLIKNKNIKITAIDINESDILLASRRIKDAGLDNNITCKCIDLFELDCDINKFNTIMFCESWPAIERDLMITMLNYVVNIKNFQGDLNFINTIEDYPTISLLIKPRLKYVMLGLLDFGKPITKQSMNEVFDLVGINHKNNITYELLAKSTINYKFFKDKIKLPGFDFEMKQYMISVKV